MNETISINGKTYDIKNLTDDAKAKLFLLQYTDDRIQELTNMQALLQRAKKSYIEALKQEILSQKAGFLTDD